MSIAYIITDSGVVTAVVNGKSYGFTPDQKNYQEVLQAIKDGDETALERYGNIAKSVHRFSHGKVVVEDGVVLYNGEPVHNSLSTRILALMEQGFKFDPFVKFLENLMKNPSKRSVDQLYRFLEHQGLPITEDGCFLAYKRVTNNWKDFHSGKVDWSIGSKPYMERNLVDDNPDSHCSYGYHAGALGYVSTFNSGGHIVIVKINPAHVVSIPNDANCQKLRAHTMEVIGEYTGELTSALYSGDGKTSTLTDNWDNDEWDNDDEEYYELDNDEFDDEDDDDY